MIPSAAPYSVTWNTERQVTPRSPLIERAFFVSGLRLCVHERLKHHGHAFVPIGGDAVQPFHYHLC